MTVDQIRSLRVYSSDTALSRPSAATLAAQELLRPPSDRPSTRDLEPFSRGWFEQIELTRYARAGAWLPRLLEFSRHGGESLLMLGPGLGTDAIQYDRHGTRVTIATTPDEPIESIRQNTQIHAREIELIPIANHQVLPFARGAFDLVYLNGLHQKLEDYSRVLDEVYRVLKPGGKLIGLFPAHYDVEYWRRWLHPCPRWYFTPPARPSTAPPRSAREVASWLKRFSDLRVWKRHLRRAELPPFWRFVPVSILERLLGRVLLVKAFKPISSVKADLAAA